MDIKQLSRIKSILLIICVLGITLNSGVKHVEAPPPARGPRIDTLTFKIVRTQATQLTDMTTGPPAGSDIWMSEIRQPWPTFQKEGIQNGGPRDSDITALAPLGHTISTRPGLHYVGIAINTRRAPLDDVNFRHALAHLIPKDRIIGTMFRYIAVRTNTPTAPTQALYYDPFVDPHEYNPGEAQDILADAGYQKIANVWRDKNGFPLPRVELNFPPATVSTTMNTIGNMIVNEASSIGLTSIAAASPLRLFDTYFDKTYRDWDFDLSLVGWNLERNAEHLWHQFSSENNYLGSNNPHGITYPQLDAELSTLWRSLSSTQSIAAARKAQELIMGGGDYYGPLPHNVQPTDPRSQAIPIIPIFGRNIYDIQNFGLQGAVNMFGYGIDNIWTWMNIYWSAGTRPGTWPAVNSVTAMVSDEPERLNPLFADIVYSWQYMGPTYDSLIATNPYTHRDEPWLATSWSCIPVPGGMDVTFDIKLTDSQGLPITWQDGTPISIDDVKFAWDFLANWQIPRYWGTFAFYDPSNTVIVDSDTIRARMTTTSPWMIYTLAGTAFLLPPQVWAVNPITGMPWFNTWQILNFDPSAYAYPDPDGGGPLIGLPTYLFGTGPFILQSSTSSIITWFTGDLDANKNYFMLTSEIQNKIEYMFWRSGDCIDDDRVNIIDLWLIASNYHTSPPGDTRADITGPGGAPPDGIIDLDDLATAARYFYEPETVPYAVGTPP